MRDSVRKSSEEPSGPTLNERIHAKYTSLSEEEQIVLTELLRLENDKLHLALPRGIKKDILDMIRRVVK